MIQVNNPYPQFFDADGDPLDNGKVYFGVADLDPRTNPKAVYSDFAGTTPVTQPIRTQNGYLVNGAGTPISVYVDGDHSIAAYTSADVLLWSAPDSAQYNIEQRSQGIVSSFSGSSGSSLIGFIQSGTGAVPRTSQDKMRESVSVKDFGAVGDGVTSDTTAWSNWVSATGGKVVPVGVYPVGGVNYICKTLSFVNTTDSNHSAGLYSLSSVTTGNANTTFGNLSGSKITTGGQNTAVGKSALESLQAGNNNTAIGFAALRYANSVDSIQNTCVGAFCGEQITTGQNNTSIGHNTLKTLTTGTFNTAVGQGALAYNVTGNYNTAVGYHSLLYYTGSNGVAFGVEALSALTTGVNNTAVGYGALKGLTTGSSSTALGFAAGGSSTASQGTYIGDSAGYALTTGAANTFIGYNSGVANQTGEHNTAVGSQSLISCISGSRNVAVGRVTLINATGSDNTAIGTGSLNASTSANFNTAVGSASLNSTTTGGTNTAIGYTALSSLTTFANCSGLGYNAQVTGSNQVQLGDSATTTYTYGAVQNRSDARDKADVRNTILGLDFIMRLRPVDFKWDYREDYGWRQKDGTKKRTRYHHGLIAQEVKTACEAFGVDFGGYQDHLINGGDDVKSIAYSELIAPLIKAVQQLKIELDALKSST